jgi:hypothetical protein
VFVCVCLCLFVFVCVCLCLFVFVCVCLCLFVFEMRGKVMLLLFCGDDYEMIDKGFDEKK